MTALFVLCATPLIVGVAGKHYDTNHQLEISSHKQGDFSEGIPFTE